MAPGVSIVIPTYNGGRRFLQCLEMIQAQSFEEERQLIIVDSGSTDGTVEAAKMAGARVHAIVKKAFHHARTRNMAVSFADYERVVFMVQDAIPCSRNWLSDLSRTLDESQTAAVYTGHIPHEDATLFARFETDSIRRARGGEPVVHHLESPDSFFNMPYEQAYRAVGLDNVCAIYKRDVLLKHPFPEVGFAEDLAWALSQLLGGHQIMYQPKIQVKHSHDRPPAYIFRRQIINSFWCAKILKRVREDLSFLRLQHLTGILNGVRTCVRRMMKGVEGPILNIRHPLSSVEHRIKDNPMRSHTKPVLKDIVKRFPPVFRVRLFLKDRFSGAPSFQAPEVKRIMTQLEEEIRHLFLVLREEYPGTGEADYTEALEQIAATVLGRTFGETYASCVLNKAVSRELDHFMRPWLTGI